MKFEHYLALGDSISIDLYPSLDTDKTPYRKVGAASVLAKRLQETHNPNMGFTNLTRDGARIREIGNQAQRALELASFGKSLLITITAGGNDISFDAMGTELSVDEFIDKQLPRIQNAWSLLIADVIAAFPEATIILNTSYDPTEGTGTFGGREVAGGWEDIVAYYTPCRELFSQYIRDAVANINATMKVNVLLADVRKHFVGHGVTTEESNRWYWREFMIEPNAEGARQIAGLWMGALQTRALVEFAERVHPAGV